LSYKLIVEDGIEEAIETLNARKAALAEGAVHGWGQNPPSTSVRPTPRLLSFRSITGRAVPRHDVTTAIKLHPQTRDALGNWAPPGRSGRLLAWLAQSRG
jgi:hypothetical protein